MTPSVRHDEIEELLGAYALDAVDADERLMVQGHLDICPRCRAEVAAHREVAALLGHSGTDAPEGLWERIADALEEAPPPMRIVLQSLEHPAGRAVPAPAPGPGTGAPAAPVVEMRRRRPQLPRVLAVAAVVAALAMIGGLGFQSIRQQQRIEDIQRQSSLEEEALDALAEPGSRRAELRAPGDEGVQEGVQAIAVVRANGEGYLLAQNLPRLDDQIYQLWGVAPGTTISLGDMGGDPEVRSFSVDPSTNALLVTVEETAVEQSDNEPALVGSLA
ncbi:hypothetical protein BH18ACT4_BH18ACT4_12040 [soil metagenome]